MAKTVNFTVKLNIDGKEHLVLAGFLVGIRNHKESEIANILNRERN